MMFGLPATGLINAASAHSWALRCRTSVRLVCICAAMLLASCENDLKQIQQISAQEVSKPIERTTGVEVIYSDSAKVKARMLTPLLLHYKVEKPYYEMPKGVKVVFFDEFLKVSSTITSEFAIRRENERVIELRRNVVATNAKGDKFESDELIWNETTRKVTSNKPVTITLTDGTIIRGNALETNERFDPWTIPSTTGNFNVNQNFSQQ